MPPDFLWKSSWWLSLKCPTQTYRPQNCLHYLRHRTARCLVFLRSLLISGVCRPVFAVHQYLVVWPLLLHSNLFSDDWSFSFLQRSLFSLLLSWRNTRPNAKMQHVSHKTKRPVYIKESRLLVFLVGHCCILNLSGNIFFPVLSRFPTSLWKRGFCRCNNILQPDKKHIITPGMSAVTTDNR